MTKMLEDLQLFQKVLGDVLALRLEIFGLMQDSKNALDIAMLMIVLAGLSSQLGHSVILFANAVRPPRFVLSILVGTGFYILNLLVWSVATWLFAAFLFGTEVAFDTIFTVVGLAQAPLLLGLFIFIPFFGIGIGWLLSFYSLLIMAGGLATIFTAPVAAVFVATLLGWLLLLLFQRSIGYPLITLAQRVRARVAGLEELRQHLQARDVLEQLEDGSESEMAGLL